MRTANAAKVNPQQPILQALAVLTLLLAASTPVFGQSVAMVTDVTGKAALQGAHGKVSDHVDGVRGRPKAISHRSHMPDRSGIRRQPDP